MYSFFFWSSGSSAAILLGWCWTVVNQSWRFPTTPSGVNPKVRPKRKNNLPKRKKKQISSWRPCHGGLLCYPINNNANRGNTTSLSLEEALKLDKANWYSSAPPKSASTKPIFQFCFGLELHSHWNRFLSRNKSHIKAVRTTVGISEKAKYLEAIIWPAVWKEINVMVRSLSHVVRSWSGSGLMTCVWMRIAATRMTVVCMAKERTIVKHQSGPKSREPEIKHKLPRRKAPTVIRAFAHSVSGLSGLSDIPRASRIMFPVQCGLAVVN